MPQTPVIYLTYPQGMEKLSLHNATVSWTKHSHADNCHPIADGYTVQIATHRSFTDNLIEYDVKNENRASLVISVPIGLHNLRLSDVEHFVRVRAYNATTRAKRTGQMCLRSMLVQRLANQVSIWKYQVFTLRPRISPPRHCGNVNHVL